MKIKNMAYWKAKNSPVKHAGDDNYAHHQKISEESSKWNRYLGSEIQYWWADRPWGDDPGGKKRLHKKYETTKKKNTKTETKKENTSETDSIYPSTDPVEKK